MVGQLEPMRRRVVEVPLHLDHPYWIDDPNFDLDFHIRHLSLAPPGRVDQLAEQIARIVGRPMDRTRPLWEVYVIEGLESGRWALLTKYHHATIDGASGVMMLNLMHDLTPDADAAGREPAVGAGADPERRRAAAADARPTSSATRPRRCGPSCGIVRELAESAGITSVGAVGPAGRRGDQGAASRRRDGPRRHRCR